MFTSLPLYSSATAEGARTVQRTHQNCAEAADAQQRAPTSYGIEETFLNMHGRNNICHALVQPGTLHLGL